MPAEAIITGLTGLFSGIHSYNEGIKNRNAIAKANAQNIALQREFAQNGIQWRAQDARNAGINPIYALGAQGATFTPSVQAETMDTQLSQIIQNAGSDLANFFSAEKQLELKKKSQELAIKQAETDEKHTTAQIELLNAQTKKINAELNKKSTTTTKITEANGYKAPNGKVFEIDKAYKIPNSAFNIRFLSKDGTAIIGFNDKDLQQAFADGMMENSGIMKVLEQTLFSVFGISTGDFVKGDSLTGAEYERYDTAGMPGIVVRPKNKKTTTAKPNEKSIREKAYEAMEKWGFTD